MLSHRSWPEPAPTARYTLSLHDALPIFEREVRQRPRRGDNRQASAGTRAKASGTTSTASPCSSSGGAVAADRKSTRLNSSHVAISYAVFCLKKKNRRYTEHARPAA